MTKIWPPVLVILSFLCLSACELNELPADQTHGQVTSTELSLVDEGQVAGSVQVAVIAAVTGKLAGQARVQPRERMSVTLALRPGLYVLHVHAFADTEARVFLGARSARLRVPYQPHSQVRVLIRADAAGTVGVGITGPDVETLEEDPQEGAVIGGQGAAAAGAASGGASASGGGSTGASASSGAGTGSPAGGGASAVGGAGGNAGSGASAGGAGAATSGGGVGGGSVSVGGGGAAVMGGGAAGGATAGAGAAAPAPPSVPIIDDVKVDVGDVVARITIQARASGGGALRYVWSGAGFSGAVAGGATAEVPCTLLSTARGQTTSVLVQSPDGVVAQVKVTFDITSQLRLGALKLGGTARTSVVSSEALTLSHRRCTDEYERCGGGCKASVSSTGEASEANGACYLACGISLADCCENSP
jgi:hypothetical protein